MHHVHPYRKAHPHSRLLTIESIIYLVFIAFLFLMSGFITGANPGAVLLGFFPAFVFGIILVVLVETDNFHPTYNWLVLVSLLVLATAIYFGVQDPVVQGIDAATCLAMNALLMTIALFIIHSSYEHEPMITEDQLPKKEVVHEHVHHVVHSHQLEQPKEITDVVHSIEDKVKALNFVIGRVYSVYHGGTDRLRNKIRIDKLWYNDFNMIDEGDIEKRRHEAIVLMQKIKDRLDLMQRTEREVFGEEATQLRNIQHNPLGSDAIITVLVRNDKDPVEQYYDSARKFCEEAIASLKKGEPAPNHQGSVHGKEVHPTKAAHDAGHEAAARALDDMTEHIPRYPQRMPPNVRDASRRADDADDFRQ